LTDLNNGRMQTFDGNKHGDDLDSTPMNGTCRTNDPKQSARPSKMSAPSWVSQRSGVCWTFGMPSRLAIVTLVSGMIGMVPPPAHAETLLVDPGHMLETAERMNFVGSNVFKVEPCPAGRCLRSTPNKSASALYQKVSIPSLALAHVRWTWRVEKLQPSADIRKLASEDFGAMIMFVFGEPSIGNKDVPTLAYVWTSTPVPNGSVLPSQRYRSLAHIQLRGRADVGMWQNETRDVITDFRNTFGTEPGPIRYIAVFNDNDQTNEAVTAVFGPLFAE
jgi:hypothetical protein